MKKQNRATVRDVAKRAGVSPITVSRVITGSGPVSEETQARVQAAIAELGYEPRQPTYQRQAERTGLIALVLTYTESFFWRDLIRGVEEALSARGISMVLGASHSDPITEERLLRSILDKHVDGFVLLPAGGQPEPVHLIQSHNVPVVVVDQKPLDVEADMVLTDSLGGGYQLTKLLLDLGHRRIGILSGYSSLYTSRTRVEGYQAALRDAGIEVNPALIQRDGTGFESGYQMTKRLIELDPMPTALFATTSGLALGMLKRLHDVGLRVPDDISAAGFDQLYEGISEQRLLTTAEQPVVEMGRLAAEMLCDRIAGRGPAQVREVVLPVKVVFRQSCAPCPRP